MTITTAAAIKSQRSAARIVLAKTMSRGHPTRTIRRRMTKLSRLYISLFILSISSQTVSNMYSTEIFYIIANRLVCWTVCPDEHKIHKKKSVWAVYTDRIQFWLPTYLPVSHTSCYAESFVFTSLITNGSSEWTVCRISHTPWSGCPFLLFCLITNSSYRSTVCPSSHTQLKSEPCLMYHSSQTLCIFLTSFFTSTFVINASHTVSSKGRWS